MRKALAYNLGNFLRTLATPEPIQDWSLTSLCEKLIKIGAKVVAYGRYIAFQMAEVSIPRKLFAIILELIATLRAPPILATPKHMNDPANIFCCAACHRGHTSHRSRLHGFPEARKPPGSPGDDSDRMVISGIPDKDRCILPLCR